MMETDKQALVLAVFLIFGGFIYLLSPILMPFLVAAALAYLGDPVVDWFEERKVNRTLAVILVFLLITLIVVMALLILIPAVSSQLSVAISKIPQSFEWFETQVVPWLNQKLHLSLSSSTVEIQNWFQQHWQDTGEIAKKLLSGLGESSIALVVWFGNLVLIPVVSFYLMRDWDKLVRHIGDLSPRKYYPMLCLLAKESDQVLGAFVRGQLLVMLVLGVIYSLGLWMTGLEVALLVGMVAGAASIVPYLGFVVGILVASIAALVQFHTMGALLPVMLVFIIGQALEGMVLTPLLVGDKIGLHPVTVIFAIMAGGQLFGFVGILIALPLAAVLAVVFRHIHGKYRRSDYYEAGGSYSQKVLPESTEVTQTEFENAIETPSPELTESNVIENEAGSEPDKPTDENKECTEKQ